MFISRSIYIAAAILVLLSLSGCTNPMEQINHPIPSDAPVTLTTPTPTTEVAR